MSLWFLTDVTRLQKELDAVRELAARSPWLVAYEWGIDHDLYLDATVRAHSVDYDLRVSFPQFYPDVPSVVRPRNPDRRLTGHQYGGIDGPLCLEWGPDTWSSSRTAADMLESAHRLFDVENPLGSASQDMPTAIAPSRDQLTIGQELRSERLRWYLTEWLLKYLNERTVGEGGGFRFSLRKVGPAWIALTHEVALEGESLIRDPSVPEGIPGAESSSRFSGVWVKCVAPAKAVTASKTLDDLRSLIDDPVARRLLARDGTSPVDGFEQGMVGVVLAGVDSAELFLILGDQSVIHLTRIREPTSSSASRGDLNPSLSEKRIGIVGLGSAGSKIAVSLAKMGIGSFYLVDHDVLLAGNVRRHALDWQSVGSMKAEAVAQAIRLVNPRAQVELGLYHLTGQESNAILASAAAKLADCDIVVDATAESRVFTLLSAVAGRASRPMVWLEIFGGGVGGLVARSIPGIDPLPREIRSAFVAYCRDNPPPAWMLSSIDYLAQREEQVLVAMDADVGVIANHAARIIVDCLAAPSTPNYQYALYLVGLAPVWVFDQPFHTIPIRVEAEVRNDELRQPEIRDDTVQFIIDLLEARSPA